ncbi:protein adenylyltransferase SelO [Palleronia caenipelagi]|uniref:Protein nucleotidyltransferase YdiU n=1 Tax=Palleronia caenipelagi TaxID=2489174 RepID=A0A547Q0H2_9RHOB|nr:YdiU family protein [Palleronia caenipelagi]TRD19778.1 YdiU family protein [Palleronia caenipelagi]
MKIPFDNSYALLPDRFFARQSPTPVAEPELFALNRALAFDLGLTLDNWGDTDAAQLFSGNQIPEGADPLAAAYAGHQFGNWVPQLGDGRAVLLGEIVTPLGRRDVQLKGAGRTPWSRGGDGRAWLGPVLREYVVSEAMHALGIPTTRALAAVTTGETVWREAPLPGAILTRVAASHIRVGTFQYFSARQDVEALRTLTDHVIARHYPDADGPEGLLSAVVAAQADLIARWMSVGFIHGVMNTDNMALSGETIDYGPCAFMDGYHPARKFSSIDRFGRYAFDQQPDIAVWNLSQLASTLLPLFPDPEAAIPRLTEVLNGFAPLFRDRWTALFRAKLGLTRDEEEDATLASDLLKIMSRGEDDFTLVFRGLGDGTAAEHITDRPAFDAWSSRWQARRSRDETSAAEQVALMDRTNPAVIPRNHRIEEMIEAAVAGDRQPFDRLTAALATPFTENAELARAPRSDEIVQATFCGT